MGQWADTIKADSRVLLIVNSQLFRQDEIEQTLRAIAARTDVSRVSCIAPYALRSRLIQLGLSAANILTARLHGLDVDLVFFLETPRAIRWSAERNATVVLGSEPYAPNNEEVKDAFELRAAALLGAASYVAHSLPDDRVFSFDVKELWRRTARHIALDQHHERVLAGMASLERAWKNEAPADAALVSGDLIGQDLDPNQPVIVDAAQHSYRKLHRAHVEDGGGWHGGVRLLVNPAGRWPANGWLSTIEPVKRPAFVASGVRWHRTRLVKRGIVEGQDSHLLETRPVQLVPGDAVLIEGHVYGGGITFGLLSEGKWLSRVDVDDAGPFMAAVVAAGFGPHTLVIASCLRGGARRMAVALHRFGWARRPR